MARVAGVLIALATLGAAGILFVAGLIFASGEYGHVYWAIRGPLWGLAVVVAFLGAGATWLAIRSDLHEWMNETLPKSATVRPPDHDAGLGD
jgi:hypothetical protein